MPRVRGLALEGGVCAGKSTVSRELETQIVGLRRVPEFMEVLSETQRRSVFEDLPDRSIDTFIDAERIRISLLGGAASACIDRSILSLIAYRYASKRLGIIGQDDLSYAVTRISDADWIIPSAFFYLDVEHATRVLRSEIRDRTNPLPYPLLNEAFGEAFREFFCRLAGAANLHIIRNDKGNTAADVARAVVALASTTHEHDGAALVAQALALIGD